MFGRKGGLDVLLGVAADRGQESLRTWRRSGGGKAGAGDPSRCPQSGRGRRREGARETIEHDAELATWRSLYGAKPIASQDVPRLRSNIGKMNLGWFENIALEQLYSRAGMAREAHTAHLAAFKSADRLSTIDDAEALLIFAGSLMWMALLIRSLARCFIAYIQGNATHGAQIPPLPTPDTQRLTPNAEEPPHLTSRTGGSISSRS